MLESMIQALIEQGAKVVEKSGKYKGKEVHIHEITLKKDDGDSHLNLFVDSRENLLIGALVKTTDSNGNVVNAEAHFSYPAKGPQDIYDLGVPRSAKVISKLPRPELSEVLKKYQVAKEGWPKRYVAVVTGSVRDSAEIIYRNGVRLRTENISNRSELPEAVAADFDSLLQWWRGDGESTLTKVRLFDGGKYHSWSVRSGRKAYQRRDPNHKGFEEIAWPAIRRWLSPNRKLKINEDAYSREKGLVRLDLYFPGSLSEGNVVSWPRRVLYYLDPTRDFLCVKRVHSKDPVLEKDPSWLNVANSNAVPMPIHLVSEVTEFTQTPGGRWYPSRIKIEWSSDTSKDDRRVSTKSISVKTHPDFPAEIFDPSKLPK